MLKAVIKTTELDKIKAPEFKNKILLLTKLNEFSKLKPEPLL
jgi:hypothetical protein